MTENIKAKKWLTGSVFIILLSLAGVLAVMLVVDPYFHFHPPLKGLSYRLYEERYINDGISRSFAFDTLITGTSMAQNFKPSEAEELFGGKAVKETFSGAGFQEISDNIDRALSRNKNLTKVIWSFEYNGLIRPYDWSDYGEFPTYLYDDDPFNDVAYVFNKEILYHGVVTNLFMTMAGQESTSMDEYSAWEKETGLPHILALYDRENVQDDLPPVLTDKEREMVYNNIKINMTDLVKKYPEVTFYLYYTPYSICYWDSLQQMGCMERQFEAEQCATELLLECPNVKLFNFYDQYDVVTNLDNYRDKEHYASWINSEILRWMARGEGLLTKDNYRERLEQERAFYSSYDYDGIY